jgi:hypothetical protein
MTQKNAVHSRLSYSTPLQQAVDLQSSIFSFELRPLWRDTKEFIIIIIIIIIIGKDTISFM